MSVSDALLFVNSSMNRGDYDGTDKHINKR